MPTKLSEIPPPQEKMCYKDSTVNLWQLSDTFWWERHSRDFFGKKHRGLPRTAFSSRRDKGRGSQDTCCVLVVLQQHTPPFQESVAQNGTAWGQLLCWAQGLRRTIKDNSAQDQLPFSGLKDPDLQAISTHSWTKMPASCSSKPEDAHVNTWVAMQWFGSRH